MTTELAPWWQRRLNDAIMAGLQATRRADPFVRPAFDATLRQPVQDTVQWLINAGRRDDGLGLAEERIQPEEEVSAKAIADLLTVVTRPKYPPGAFLRAGNTKTYAVVDGSFTVHKGLPLTYRYGVFAKPQTFRARVRLSGPGPSAPPDIKDNGILSIGIKLLDVPGPKLLGSTVDFTALSAPMFTTPDVAANVELQRYLRAGIPLLYFLNPRRPHLLNATMQALYAKTHANPLDATYWSCVPYLLGRKQAMKYRITPVDPTHSAVPLRPADDYLQQAVIETLTGTIVRFDYAIQLQTDPHRMPIENATVIWPEHLSPHQIVATLTIPAQTINPAEQFHLAEELTYNPWHTLAAHRPLGNQNRARRAIYHQLAHLRQSANHTPEEGA
jgi:hypothetical protein